MTRGPVVPWRAKKETGDNILIITSNRNEETMTRFFQGNKNA